MKTLVKLTLLTLFLSPLNHAFAQWGGKKVVGNGNITTKSVNTASYNEIKVVGSMDIHLMHGTEGSITVTADENLHEYLEIEVSNGILSINSKKNYYLKSKKGIHVNVPVQEIDAVNLVGSGDIDTKDTLNAERLKIEITGSGDVKLDLNAQEVVADITGSGAISLTGNTGRLNVSVTGSGDFKGFDLTSKETDVSVNGSGDAEVVATEMIKARVSGSGDIVYKGNPERSDTKTSGSGDIATF